MGNPANQHLPAATGALVALAVVLGFALLIVGGAFLLGASYWGVRSVQVAPPPVPSIRVMESGATTVTTVEEPLVVEIDQEGNTSYNGEQLPLELIEARFSSVSRILTLTSDNTAIRVEEGCPYEHVDKVREMFRRLGAENPQMSSVPPDREVTIVLDAEGKVAVDGQPAEDVTGALQKILNRHGSRATVMLQVDPQCPSEFVVRTLELCRGFGRVQIHKTEAAEAPE
jgi:biopolymer transport protein ExbD